MKMLWGIVIAILGITNVSVAQLAKYTLEGNELKTGMPVVFKTGSDLLDPESDSALTVVKNFLADKSYISLLRIEGHVASDVNEEVALASTKKRVLAVAKWLVANGVSPSRIIAVAFGSSKPVATNTSAEGRAANNRISFVNAAIRNIPIGGMPLDGGGVTVCNPCTF